MVSGNKIWKKFFWGFFDRWEVNINFPIVNVLIYVTIFSLTYLRGLCSLLIRYSRACYTYQDFLKRELLLSSKLLLESYSSSQGWNRRSIDYRHHEFWSIWYQCILTGCGHVTGSFRINWPLLGLALTQIRVNEFDGSRNRDRRRLPYPEHLTSLLFSKGVRGVQVFFYLLVCFKFIWSFCNMNFLLSCNGILHCTLHIAFFAINNDCPLCSMNYIHA